MNKLKTFWIVLRRSASDPSYYKDILKAKFSFSVKYLALLYYILSLVSGVYLAVNVGSFVPNKIPEFQDRLVKAAESFYPKDLVLTVAGGKLSTNVEEPYYIDLPKEFGDMSDNPDSEYVNFITIDTSATLADLAEYKTAILVTESGVFYPSSNDYRAMPFSDLEDFVLDREGYDALLAKGLPYLDYLPQLVYILAVLLIVIFPFVGMVFGVAGRLVYLVFAAFVVWLMAKIMKKDLSYGQTYKLSIHGLTLPIIYGAVIGLSGAHYPYVYSIVFVVFMMVVLVKGGFVSKKS